MMKKLTRVVLCLALALMLVLSLAACNKGGNRFATNGGGVGEQISNEEGGNKISNNLDKADEEEVEEEEDEPKKASDPSAINVKLDKTYTVGDAMEFTLTSSEWVEEILPSNTSDYYSEIADKDGEKYFVIRGTVKNLAGEEIDMFYVHETSITINGKYTFDAEIDVEDNEGDSFYGNIKPLQTMNVIIYASVSDEAYETYETLTLDMALTSDADSVGEFFYEDETEHKNYTMTFEK